MTAQFMQWLTDRASKLDATGSIPAQNKYFNERNLCLETIPTVKEKT